MSKKNRKLFWEFENTLFLVVSLVVFYFLAQTPAVDSFIKSLGTTGYFGAFIAGIFFVSTYTVLPAGYVLYELASYLNPIEIALVAAAGSMVGDYIIFRYIKDKVFSELRPHLHVFGKPKVRRLFSTPYFAWLIPISGAIIIASPLPDELGISLLGLSKMRNLHFLLISYLLNAAGIFFVVLLAQST